jgi:hypothetical protein
LQVSIEEQEVLTESSGNLPYKGYANIAPP